jgi:hypothetical protein
LAFAGAILRELDTGWRKLGSTATCGLSHCCATGSDGVDFSNQVSGGRYSSVPESRANSPGGDYRIDNMPLATADFFRFPAETALPDNPIYNTRRFSHRPAIFVRGILAFWWKSPLHR